MEEEQSDLYRIQTSPQKFIFSTTYYCYSPVLKLVLIKITIKLVSSFPINLSSEHLNAQLIIQQYGLFLFGISHKCNICASYLSAAHLSARMSFIQHNFTSQPSLRRDRQRQMGIVKLRQAQIIKETVP